jgi:hypothetical protein
MAQLMWQLRIHTATAAGTYVFTMDANNATSCTTTASITLDPIPTTVFNTQNGEL